MGRYDVGIPALVQAPDFFRSRNYQLPNDQKDTPFQRAFSTDLSFYDYLESQPNAAKNFQTYIESIQTRLPLWINWFPVQEEILEGLGETKTNRQEPEKIVLVDVGGGKGRYIKLFEEKFPATHGRLVLQDRAAMLATADNLGAGIQKVTYDFFTPQTIQGNVTFLYLNAIS